MITNYRTENSPKPPALSVSELNRQIKRMIEVSYGQVWVTGELSSLSRPGSGHWYFTLKDDRAQVRCAMFRSANQRLKFVPKEGDELLIRAKASLYEGRGDYQLIVEGMEPAGVGQLQAAFEALKLKLSNEGLFDPEHKKALPSTPKKIAVITSKTGAVIHDILSVTQRRFPALQIVVLPVVVQGDNAAEDIARAIEFANQHNIAEALIVGRGGGSLEDLWAFNEERVARAIYASQLPIVSAVGHETDFSIADMVADYRAPTPSAAAEQLTPDQYELAINLDEKTRRLLYLVKNQLSQCNEHTQHLSRRLRHPTQLLDEKLLRAGELSQRLRLALRNKMERSKQSLQAKVSQVHNYTPHHRITHYKQTCAHLLLTIYRTQNQIMEAHKHNLAIAAQTLNTVSPLATLDRGYSILRADDKKQSEVIKSVASIKPGQRLSATLSDGIARCEVLSVETT